MLQFTRRSLSSSFWSKNLLLKRKRTLFSWFGSEWLPVVSKTKSDLKGRRFQDTEDIQKNVTMALKAVPQQEFLKCFQQWQHRWAKCTAAEEEYFESDPSQ
jgi:hypothetical protein